MDAFMGDYIRELITTEEGRDLLRADMIGAEAFKAASDLQRKPQTNTSVPEKVTPPKP